MLFDLGWSEILLIGVVALVFIGPKDLPKAMRVAGYWIRKARTLSREFQSSIDQMIREAELDEMRQDLKKATEFDLDKEFHNTIDPTGSLSESLKPPELPNFSQAEGLPSPINQGGVAEATEAAAEAPARLEPASVDTAPPAMAPPEPSSGEPGSGEPGSGEPGSGEPSSGEPAVVEPAPAASASPTAVVRDSVPPKP
jgi:sec-independent protein translocase protein TatB